MNYKRHFWPHKQPIESSNFAWFLASLLTKLTHNVVSSLRVTPTTKSQTSNQIKGSYEYTSLKVGILHH